MKRAINLELYRLKKNKYPWIILLLSIISIIGSVYMTKSDYNLYLKDANALENLKKNYRQVSMGVFIGSVMPDWLDEGSIPITELFMRNFQSKVFLMFQTIFVVLYAGEEIDASFLKNISTAFPKKIDLVMGKIIAIGAFTILLFITNFVAMVLSFYLMEGYVSFINTSLFIKYILVEYLLYLSYGSFIMLLAYLIRNSAITIFIGMLDTIGVLQIFDNIIYQISKNTSSSIMNYLVSGNTVLLSIEADSKTYIRAILVSIIWSIISALLTSRIFRKRDIY